MVDLTSHVQRIDWRLGTFFSTVQIKAKTYNLKSLAPVAAID